MTSMAKAAEGVTWHVVDRVHDFRFSACGQPLDLGRQLHHTLVADHLRCQRPACQTGPVSVARGAFVEAGQVPVGALVVLAVVLVVAVLLGAVVPITVWPWLAYGGAALFVLGAFAAPPRRRRR